MNDLEDIGQNQRSMAVIYPLMWSFAPSIEIIHPELYMLYSGHKMCHIFAVSLQIIGWMILKI